MLIIGDVHGKFGKYRKILKDYRKKNPSSQTIQIGDMGVGFEPDKFPLKDDGELHKFFRGNHDNPQKSREHPCYMKNASGEAADFGWFQHGEKKVFWLAGAWSIDREARKEGVDWWPDEELSMHDAYAALDLYREIKPEIVLSHDGPITATHRLCGGIAYPTRTSQLLQAMLEYCSPELWIFGHWHNDFNQVIGDTRFICLPELQTLEI